MEPSDVDIALIDALKAIIETLVGKGVTSYEEIAQSLQLQLGHVQENNPEGVSVFHRLLEFCSR